MSDLKLEVAPNIERLTPYVPGKPLEELERELGIKNAIKLASNENPMGPSPKALSAASDALRQGHRYPDGYKLRADLAQRHQVSMNEVVLGNGSNELIDLIYRTFAIPGSHAVYPDPSFVCYRIGATATNMTVSEVALVDSLSYDVDALISAVRPETRLLFVANPNNPTGAYVGRAGLERLLSRVPEHVLVVLDEAYVEFADAEDYTSALALRDCRENLMVLRTFSKAYGLAAFRVGYGISTPRVINYLERVRAPFNVSSIGLAAARAALTDDAYLAAYLEHNRRERVRVFHALSQLGLRVAPSQANFLLVNFERPGKDIYERMLQKGVIIRPMPPPISTWQRITLGLTEENDRLLTAVRELLEEMR